MKAVQLLLFMLVAGGSFLSAQEEEFRTFTSSDGKSLEARLLKINPDSVIIQNRNRQNFTVPLDRLSDEDQGFIQEEEERRARSYVPNLELRYQSGKGDRSNEFGDFDDRFQYLEPNVYVTNRDLDFVVADATATVVVFGEHVVNRGEYKVLFRETFGFTVRPGDTFHFEGPKIRNEYDDTNSVRYGYTYDGYVVVVKNADGITLAVKGSGRYDKEKMVEKALTLEMGQIVYD